MFVRSRSLRLRFSIDDSREFILLGKHVLQPLQQYRQLQPHQEESGGLLLGRRLKQGSHCVVDKLTEPNSCDKATRTTFHRSFWHNVHAKREWRKSEGTQNLLGLWHTHPEAYPTPSSTDFNDWRRLLARKDNFGTEFFFLIVGTKAIYVWKGITGEKQFIQLGGKDEILF